MMRIRIQSRVNAGNQFLQSEENCPDNLGDDCPDPGRMYTFSGVSFVQAALQSAAILRNFSSDGNHRFGIFVFIRYRDIGKEHPCIWDEVWARMVTQTFFGACGRILPRSNLLDRSNAAERQAGRDANHLMKVCDPSEPHGFSFGALINRVAATFAIEDGKRERMLSFFQEQFLPGLLAFANPVETIPQFGRGFDALHAGNRIFHPDSQMIPHAEQS